MQAVVSEDKLTPWYMYGPEVSIPANSHTRADPPGPGMPPRWVDFVSHASTAYAVLAIGIVLSAAAAYWTASLVQREVRLKYESAVDGAREAVDSRIRAYSDVLLGVRGLFTASDAVTRGEFRDYIDSLALSQRYPGIQGINYAQRIPAAQAQTFVAMTRNDTSVDPRGYPGYTIKPPGNRPEYVVVKYVEPTAGNEAALGLDLAGDAVRLAALERTRDSGRLTASASIALSFDPRKHPGFAMRLPIYRKGMPLATVAERREAFTGVVSAAFVVIDLMRGVLSEPFLQTVHLRIHDAGFVGGPQGTQPAAAEDLMFDSDRLLPLRSAPQAADGGELAILSSRSSLEVGGRRWNLQFSARQEFASFSERWLASTVMLGGIIISLLLFGLIRSLASAGARALALAANITEDLRRSEANLAEAQRTTQELIEVLPNPIFFKRTDGRYFGVNKAWETYFGLPRATFLGKTVHDLYPDEPDLAQRLAAQDQLLWQHPGTQVYETAITTPDGQRHDTIYYKATFTHADGSVAGLIGIIIDITERKRVEEALRESEARFRSLTELSSDWYWEQDRALRLSFHSSGFARRSGTTSDKLLGKCRWEEPNRVPLSGTWDAHRATLEAHQPFRDFEYVRIGDDGEQYFVSLSGVPIYDAAGNFNGYRGIGTNITERKRAEQALVESETRYRSMIAAMAEGVVVRDQNARIVTCNASAERILGRTLEQMRGSKFFDPSWEWFREDGTPVPHEQRPVNTALRTGQTQSNEVVGLRKGDGSVLWLSMNVQPLFGEADTAPSGIVTTFTDITQRKQAELRQAMEHGVTRLLSESDTPDEVMPKIIRTICEALGFACGARMLRDEDGHMIRCAETWSAPSAEVMDFVEAGRQPMHAEPAAFGLIRRVWASGEPVWITDVVEGGRSGGAPLAPRAGPHGAFAFPILLGNEILGVMGFFSRASRPPDEVLLQSVRSIGAQIGQFMARRQAEERVHHLAHYDELTGLPNRSMFNQRLTHALAQARRHDKPLAILFIDLDRFKNLNDTLGHQAGDRVLKQVAERLRGCLREGDTVGRLGGDEFVVLIEEMAQPMQVAAVAQKIIAAVAQPFILDAHEFHITASIGISTYPDDSEDMQGLLKNADISMYRAKDQGKNTYQFYSALMNIHTVERLALESGLRRALERNEFVLHYQAKVDIGSGRITGMEALVRWQRPGQELIAPAQFIALAEETGLIVPIGEWVLKTACARNRGWREQGLPPLRMAVNLSARQFAHEDLLQDVTRALNETGLDPAALEFEITESMVMHDPERAVKLLTGLKDMRIHLSIDDFGTGYSSLR
jgi:diguanylate cyclase (GGDEF)-like protein/PAS domain S-box-containing protein